MEEHRVAHVISAHNVNQEIAAIAFVKQVPHHRVAQQELPLHPAAGQELLLTRVPTAVLDALITHAGRLRSIAIFMAARRLLPAIRVRRVFRAAVLRATASVLMLIKHHTILAILHKYAIRSPDPVQLQSPIVKAAGQITPALKVAQAVVFPEQFSRQQARIV